MKKVLVGAIISFFAAFAAASVDLTILTKVEQSDHKWIKPCITIKNNSLTNNIQLQGKIVKYYFYAIGLDYTTLQFATWSCPVSGVTIRVIPYTPEYTAGAKKANFVFEMKFTQSTIINKNSTLGEFKYGFHTPDWRVFYEDDDWSYSPTANYTQNNNVPIFDGTTLYWGNPPPAPAGGPTITKAAWADPNPVPGTATDPGTTTTLNVTATGTGTLIYTWSLAATPPPPAPVTFSPQNGSSLGYQTIAYFTKAGSYAFTVTVTDLLGGTPATSTTSTVVVNQKLTSISVLPASATVSVSGTQLFTATALDQFGANLAPQPTSYSWSVTGGGTIVSGLFTAGATAGGPYVVGAASGGASGTASVTVSGGSAPTKLDTAKQLIKHVIIIMQENRSFDHYFGTFPGVDGITANDSSVYNDGTKDSTYKPYHNTLLINDNNGHNKSDAIDDINGGKMNHFVHAKVSDAMGYHDSNEIANYWKYAQNFVLQDELFASCISWSKPSHLFMVSGWSATGSSPMTCVSDINDEPEPTDNIYYWTDITYLLFNHKKSGIADPISWGYYDGNYWDLGCTSCDGSCINSTKSSDKIMWFWSPLKHTNGSVVGGFNTVINEDYQSDNVQELSNFFHALTVDSVPAVNWIVPGLAVSEHAYGTGVSVRDGQAYVTSIINAVMNNPHTWDSCAIFLSWDDWGGFYDHVVPPSVDGNGYGIRVPGLVIGPYAKMGYIDHQQLSHDAYLKLIEDLFIDGQRIDGASGRPDSRPTPIRESLVTGDLLNDFDFTQPPRAPYIRPCKP